jgi:ribosome-associated protein
MIAITATLALEDSEVEWSAMRAQGKGGQNVNKTSTAVHLRFDVRASSLPEAVKERVLARRDQRLTREGIVVIKAQQHRSQEQNRAAAIERLVEFLRACAHVPRTRRATKPTGGSQRRRLESKSRDAHTKALRRRVGDAE